MSLTVVHCLDARYPQQQTGSGIYGSPETPDENKGSTTKVECRVVTFFEEKRNEGQLCLPLNPFFARTLEPRGLLLAVEIRRVEGNHPRRNIE